MHLYQYTYRDQRDNTVSAFIALDDAALTPDQAQAIRDALEASEYFIPADLTDELGQELGIPELQAMSPRVAPPDSVVWHIFNPSQVPLLTEALPLNTPVFSAAAFTGAFARKPKWDVLRAMSRHNLWAA